MKPTVEFILRSFRDSGKRHLVLTGSKQSGKSTRFREIVGDRIPGISSYAVPRDCVMLRENGTESEWCIGRFNGERMVLTDELTKYGAAALERAVNHAGEWIGIDELGYLESGSEAFQCSVFHAFDTKRVIAVLRKQHTPFLDAVRAREDVFVVDLDEMRLNVGCVIMASGLSKRFGDNKLLAEFRGKTLIQRVIDTTEGLYDGRVVVTRTPEVASLCEQQGLPVIFHTLPGRNDAVRLGTEYLKHMDVLMFCPCDQPMLSRDSLKRMLDAQMLHDNDMIRLGYGDEVGAPIMFGKRYFAELCNLPQNTGGGVLAERYKEKVHVVLSGSPWELYDVDTKDALQQLMRICEI